MTDAVCPLVCTLFILLYDTLLILQLIMLPPFLPPSLHVSQPEGETPPRAHSSLLLASTSMADSRKPEDGAPQWDPSGGQEAAGNHGANGYSAYRTCQPSGTQMATGPYSTRENGFNGELSGAPAITAGKICLKYLDYSL